MRFIHILLLSALVFSPFGAFAQSGLLDSESTLSDLKLLIAQYETRIKKLEAENTVLKYQMTKAGIQIPISDLSGAMIAIPTTLATGSTTPPPASSASGVDTRTEKYGKDVTGFITRVNKEWEGIRSHYKLAAGSRIVGYEFVQTGAMDHVFVDIVIGTGVLGVYDTKILYQFDKTDYKRKMIGIFDYSTVTSRYTTRFGNNPFGAVIRAFVKDPSVESSTAVTPTPATIPSTSQTGATVVSATSSTSSIADIMKAYNEKRYLSTINLSDAYLAKNPATPEILNVRYRTYFIIGKYSESLAELAKIEKISSIDKQTACNAQVIATYSKNQSLIDKYTTICKK